MSTPTSTPVCSRWNVGCGAVKLTCQRPERSCEMVAMPYSAGSGRDNRNLTGPSFGTPIVAHLRFSLVTVTSRTLNERWPLWNDRHVGRRCEPPHQFFSAWSKSRSACCCTDEDPSPSHEPLRASASWRDRSALFGVGPQCGRYRFACSNAMFHTWRVWAQCIDRVSMCRGTG